MNNPKTADTSRGFLRECGNENYATALCKTCNSCNSYGFKSVLHVLHVLHRLVTLQTRTAWQTSRSQASTWRG